VGAVGRRELRERGGEPALRLVGERELGLPHLVAKCRDTIDG
jgi:hypothetical protein